MREKYNSYNLYLKDSRVISVTSEFLYLIEYSEDDIVNKTIQDLLALLKSNFNTYEKINKDKNYYIFTRKCKPIEVDIIIDKDVVEFIVKQDYRLEDKFLFLEELYKEERLGVAIFAVPDLILLKANQTYLDLLDEPFNTKGKTHGQKISDFITRWKGSSSEDRWRNVLSTGEILRIDEYEYNHLKRGKIFCKISLVPIKENNVIKYLVYTSEEITEQYLTERLIEEQAHIVLEENDVLEKTLSNQEKFFSFISHEFKTPLTVTMSAVQAMELICKNELSSISKKYIKKIYQSSLQQIRLVNNLLDITRADSGYLKVNKKNMNIVSMTKAIVDSITLYASDKNINIECTSPSTEIITAIDDEKYERIILNLLSNAIKFTQSEGNIYVNINKKDEFVYITISDEGVGIPKEKQKLIFERFGQVNNSLTRDSEGTGIGLCLVKLLVNALGGDITVESTLGVGSTFKIILPIDLVKEEEEVKSDLMSDRLVRTVNVEFSNIYSE